MANNKLRPKRSKPHETNDIGTAIFHYAISKHMVSRSIEKNDYGIDELIDVVDLSTFKDKMVKILPGQMFAVQLKSSINNSKSHTLRKNSTLNYLFYNNIPTFLVKVNVKTKKYSFANIRKQVRKNWVKFNNSEPFSLKLSSSLIAKNEINILHRLKDKYLEQPNTSEVDLELNYLLSNACLLMEFSYELRRDEMELDILLFLTRFSAHITFLKNSIGNKNDLGVVYGKVNSSAELLLTLLNEDFNSLFRCQTNDDRPDLRTGLIYQELANMYLALEAIRKLLQVEREYWDYKYGYRMNNIWPEKLSNNFVSMFGDISNIVECGRLERLSVLLDEIK